jgi:hypothetical protein
MTLPRIMQYALLGAIAALAIPLVAYMTIHFTPVLNAQEREVIAFVSTPLSLQIRGWKAVNRTCPVAAITGLTPVIPAPSPFASVNRAGYNGVTADSKIPEISFILHGNDTRMAIVDGYVLKEGNSFNGWRVMSIEQKRVLLENKKGGKWISIK